MEPACWPFLKVCMVFGCPLFASRALLAEVLLLALLHCLRLLSGRCFAFRLCPVWSVSCPLSAPWASFAAVAFPCSAPLSGFVVWLLFCLLSLRSVDPLLSVFCRCNSLLFFELSVVRVYWSCLLYVVCVCVCFFVVCYSPKTTGSK